MAWESGQAYVTSTDGAAGDALHMSLEKVRVHVQRMEQGMVCLEPCALAGAPFYSQAARASSMWCRKRKTSAKCSKRAQIC